MIQKLNLLKKFSELLLNKEHLKLNQMLMLLLLKLNLLIPPDKALVSRKKNSLYLRKFVPTFLLSRSNGK